VSGSEVASTLKPPPRKALAAFRLSQIGDDTVATYLEQGWSLAICCQDCARLVEWTPPMLIARFGEANDTPIAAIAERLACAGETGCGSRRIAVFPHLYDGPWDRRSSKRGPATR
jgi:hypothetical protein